MNLLCSEEPEADAALHFNPRLDVTEVVFNSKERGAWGPEERGPGLPFQRGQPFEVLIITTEDGFKVRLCDREVPQQSARVGSAVGGQLGNVARKEGAI